MPAPRCVPPFPSTLVCRRAVVPAATPGCRAGRTATPRARRHSRAAPAPESHAGCPLELELFVRLGHLPLQPLDHDVGLAGHEIAEVVDDTTVLVRADPADARRTAFADVAEQTRPADLAGPLEDASRAGASREDSK